MALKLHAEVGLDGSGFEHGLSKLQHGAEHGFRHLKDLAIEAFGIYSIGEAIKKTVEYGEHIIDTSRRIGVGVEALQEFGFAARQNGADIENLTGFIEKLNAARLDPKKAASFAKLGISESDQKKSSEELLMEISAHIRNKSSQEVIGPLRDIGGRGAGALIPMLKDNLEEVREEARKLGAVMKTEDAVMLKFLADEMKILGQVITVGLAPAITIAIDKFLRFTNTIKAAGTFWGGFTGGSSLREKAAAILGGFGMIFSPEESEAARKKIAKSFTEAGAKSDTELTDLNQATDKQIEDLIKKQKDIEKINDVPEFQPHNEKKEPKLHNFTDNLTRAGNFLGGNQDVMQSIGHEHTRLLKQIAINTKHKGVAGGQDANNLNGNFA